MKLRITIENAETNEQMKVIECESAFGAGFAETKDGVADKNEGTFANTFVVGEANPLSLIENIYKSSLGAIKAVLERPSEDKLNAKLLVFAAMSMIKCESLEFIKHIVTGDAWEGVEQIKSE